MLKSNILYIKEVGLTKQSIIISIYYYYTIMSHSDNCALFFSEIIMLMYTIPMLWASGIFFSFFFRNKTIPVQQAHTKIYIYVH